MTQEDKDILLKDLCARLPYGVYMDAYPWQRDEPSLLIECTPAYHNQELVLSRYAGRVGISDAKVKPYLRPMSNMTEEEEKVFNDFLEFQAEYVSDADLDNKTDMYDWLNAHHFDYRGMIEKGLALEAPEGMYKQ